MAVFLSPDQVLKVQSAGKVLTINQKIIPDSARAIKYVTSYVKKGQPVKPCRKLSDGTGIPNGITIHNTDEITPTPGTTQGEQYCRATWPNCNMGGVVVHFFVYKSEIWQTLSEDEQGWHASDGVSRRVGHRSGQTIGGNLDTIAIEAIGPDPETEETTSLLTAYLLHKHKLNPWDVYTHNFWMGNPDKIVGGVSKNCPVYILPHWTEFLSRISELYAASSTAQSPTIYRIQVGAFSVRANADAYLEKVREAGFPEAFITD